MKHVNYWLFMSFGAFLVCLLAAVGILPAYVGFVGFAVCIVLGIRALFFDTPEVERRVSRDDMNA